MLKLENICKKLGDFRLTGISLDIPEREYCVLLGRSGSGKTQLLELIAGLKIPDSGKIWIDNEDVTRKKIQERNIGLVFQDYAIFPNMTVFGNIAYSLHCRKIDKTEISRRVQSIAEELNVVHLLNRYTENLSGGELQRVALARTLITSPGVLLLDEPLASVDTSLRDGIRRIFRQLNKKGLTIVHVTHDFREAVSLASRVGVLHNGHIIQTGTPDDVFGNPASKFVARYSGIRNFYKVEFFNEGGVPKARCNGTIDFRIGKEGCSGKGLLIIRSDAIRIHAASPDDSSQNCFRGLVSEVSPSGYGMEIIVEAGESFHVEIGRQEFRSLRLNEGSEVWITFPPEAAVALKGTEQEY